MARTRPISAIAALLLLFLPSRGFGDYAFVYANSPTESYYFPNHLYQHNSTGAKNTITRVRTGVYRVLMPNMQKKPWGNVQVTAHGATTDFCNVGAWKKTGVADLTIEVYCFDSATNPIDSRFTALYHDNEDAEGGGGLAYTFADQPSATSVYYGKVANSYNSEWPDRATGVSIRPEPRGLPYYRVVFPGWEALRQPPTGLWDASPGNLQLTTVDSRPNRCWVTSQYYSSEGFVVDVGCNTHTRFSLAHFRDRVPGSPRTIGAYVTVGIDFDMSYYGSPVVAGYYNPLAPSATPVVTHLDRGRYRVDLPLLAHAYTTSTVQVTSLGYWLPTFCKVRSWSRLGEDVSVYVDCYGPSSATLTNSVFYMSFVTDGTY